MKQVKRFCAATLLVLVLSLTAFAGDILSPAATDPLPTGEITSSSAITPAPANIESPAATSTTDLMTEFALELCAQLLSIF